MRLLLPLLALFVFTQTAAAQDPVSLLVEEGDAVAGVGSITRVDNLVVNDGGLVRVEVDTDNANTDADGALIDDALTALLVENQGLPAPVGALLDSFDALTLNNLGESAVNFFLDGTAGSSDDSGLYFGTTLVIQESDATTAVDWTAGTPYIGFFETKFNDARQILAMSSLDDPNIPSSVDRGLMLIQIDGLGNLVSETTVAKEGDVLPGQVSGLTDMGTGPHDFALNVSGQALYTASIAEGDALYLDTTLLAQEGSASPVGGRNYDIIGGAVVALNNAGDWAIVASIEGDTADDGLIVSNGQVVAREGSTHPAISPFVFTSFGSGPIHVAPDGRVGFYAVWDDPDTTQNEGFILGDKLIVQKGVTIATGTPIFDVSGVQDGSDLSDDGSFFLFEGMSSSGVDAVYRVDLFTLLPPDPGTAGIVNDFVVKNAAPLERVFYAYARNAGTTNVPNCPGLTVGLNNPVVFGFADADGAGSATLSVSVPNNASGRTIYLQAAQKISCRASNRVVYTFP